VEILPTKRGRFHAEITQIGMNKLWMQRFKMSLPQLSNVAIRPGRKVIGFLIETSSSIVHHCGMEVTPNDILVAGFDLLHQRSDAGFRPFRSKSSLLHARQLLVVRFGTNHITDWPGLVRY
jgi:hypothetical protein